MTPRIVTEESEDRSIDTGPAIVRPTYLHWSPIFAGAIVAAAVSFVLLSFGIGDRFGGRLAVIQLAGYVLSAGPACGSTTADVACRLWAGRIPGR
jgi:hypothetical protein